MESNGLRPAYNTFVQLFRFADDPSKHGRVLSSVQIGDVFMSRLLVEPSVTTGNYYHKQTSLMFYVEKGNILAGFEHVRSKQRRRIDLEPGKQVVHLPPYVALATKNMGRSTAVVVFFSNKPLRSDDDYPYSVLP
jgi:hypothetical protein